MSKKDDRLIVRRVQPASDAEPMPPALTQNEAAFIETHQARGRTTRYGKLQSRITDEASERAAVCIAACEGLSLIALKENGLWTLIEAARAAVRLLEGRLVRVDSEAGLVRDNLKRSLRGLGV
jgi:hypothetical protein